MFVAKSVAVKSKDPSVQVGAVIVGPDHEIRSTGWNGFPRGVSDDLSRYEDRNTKLLFVVHAEMNAICNAARCGTSLHGCSIYIWPLPPCNECSKAIIQVGIKEVIFLNDFDSSNADWKRLWLFSKTMFDEANVRWRAINSGFL